MEHSQPLFSLDIPLDNLTRSNVSSVGNITCTQPLPQIYLLTFTASPDNRLTRAFNTTFFHALDKIEDEYPKGVVITTSGISKFYSNGLDYETAVKDETFFESSLYPLWRRLLSYPMPTVALINGHAFAGGLMTAMMHDYRIMNPHRGFLCLNELDFGSPLNPPMVSIFRVKLPSMTTLRNMTLQSRRYSGADALKEGIIDGVGGIEEAKSMIEQLKLLQKAKSSSYGLIKEELYREVLGDLGVDEAGKGDKPKSILGEVKARL